MVNAFRGVLLRCDPTIREFVLHLNEQDRFVIRVLDSTHLFIEAKYVDKLQKRLDELMDENTYTFIED